VNRICIVRVHRSLLFTAQVAFYYFLHKSVTTVNKNSAHQTTTIKPVEKYHQPIHIIIIVIIILTNNLVCKNENLKTTIITETNRQGSN